MLRRCMLLFRRDSFPQFLGLSVGRCPSEHRLLSKVSSGSCCGAQAGETRGVWNCSAHLRFGPVRCEAIRATMAMWLQRRPWQ